MKTKLSTTTATRVFYCTKPRCVKKEKKEPDSTRLKFIKSWKVTNQNRVWMETGLFECPKCHKRYRRHIGSGRDAI